MSLLQSLNQTLRRFFTLIIKAWLHSHHFWTCPRNSWRRSCDHLMHQSLIGRSEHLGLINLYALHMNAKDLQNLIRLPAGPVVRTSKRSRFLKRMQISLLNTCLASKWCCHVDFRACHLFAHHFRLALCSQLDLLSCTTEIDAASSHLDSNTSVFADLPVWIDIVDRAAGSSST